MKNYRLLLILLLCSLNVSARRPCVIFDTDLGNDIDDALALDMLYKYHARHRLRLLGIMLCKDGVYPHRYVDVMNTWYGHCVPIGLSRNPELAPTVRYYTQTVCEAADAQGRPLYKRRIADYAALPSAISLYRQLLAKAKDHSVTIVAVGFSTNLAALLNTKADSISPLTGRELVERKVVRLVMMGGDFLRPDHAEFNVRSNPSDCRKVMDEWPSEIVASPYEVGSSVLFPGRVMAQGFAWCKGHHPLVDSYKFYRPQWEDSPAYDLTAVLYAAEPEANYFTVSPAGRVSVTPEGHTHFTPLPGGRFRYLSVTPLQAERVQHRLVELVSQKP